MCVVSDVGLWFVYFVSVYVGLFILVPLFASRVGLCCVSCCINIAVDQVMLVF